MHHDFLLLLFVTRVLQLAIGSAPSSLCSSCIKCASLPQSRLRPPCETSSPRSLLQHCIPQHARSFVCSSQSNTCDVTPLVQPHHGASVSQVAGARVCCAEHRRVGCFRPLPAVCAVVSFMCVCECLCVCVYVYACAQISMKVISSSFVRSACSFVAGPISSLALWAAVACNLAG